MVTSQDYTNEEWQQFADNLYEAYFDMRRAKLYGNIHAAMVEANNHAKNHQCEVPPEEVEFEPVPNDALVYLSDMMGDAASEALWEIQQGKVQMNYSEPAPANA